MDWEPDVPGQFDTPLRTHRKRSAVDAGFSIDRSERHYLIPTIAPETVPPAQDWTRPIAHIFATTFRIIYHLCSFTVEQASRFRRIVSKEKSRRVVEIRQTTSDGQESVKRRATDSGRLRPAAPTSQQIARRSHHASSKKTSQKSSRLRNATMSPPQGTSAQPPTTSSPEPIQKLPADGISHMSGKSANHREALGALILASFTPPPLPGIAGEDEVAALPELVTQTKESKMSENPPGPPIAQEPFREEELDVEMRVGDRSPQIEKAQSERQNYSTPTRRSSSLMMEEPSATELVGSRRSVRTRHSHPPSSGPGLREIFGRPKSGSFIPKHVRFATNPLSGSPQTQTVKFYKESIVGDWAPSSPWAEEQAVRSMSDLDAHLQALVDEQLLSSSAALSVLPEAIKLSPNVAQQENLKNEVLLDKLGELRLLEELGKLEMSRLMKEKKLVLKKKREMALAAEAEMARAKAIAEEAQRRARTNRRMPEQKLVQPLSREWEARIEDCTHKGDQVAVTTSVSGMDIRRRDLMTVLGEREWLNDEIINAYIDWIVHYANEKAGKNGRTVTPKVIAHSSFFYHNLVTKGPQSVSGWMKRKRAQGKKLLDVETILIPVNNAAHWTIIVVSPKARTIEYLDSFSGPPRTFIKHTKDWLGAELGSAWHEDEWAVLATRSAEQLNGYDCGVFTVTNAECVVRGLDTGCYDGSDMAAQRRRIAAVLLNRGFGGDFAPVDE